MGKIFFGNWPGLCDIGEVKLVDLFLEVALGKFNEALRGVKAGVGDL